MVVPRAIRPDLRVARPWLRRAAFGLAALYVLYVASVWLLLRLHLLERLTADQEALRLDIASGYSLWPGVVRLRDARLAFMDYNVEVEVSAARVELDVGVVSLLTSTLRIEKLEAEGASFRMTHRVQDGLAHERRLQAFPDLGFGRSRVYEEPKPPYRPLPRTLVIEAIEAEVVEAWLLEYRAVGTMRATGGFQLGEEIDVFPSRVTAERVSVFVGEKRLAEQARCDISGRVGPFERRSGELDEVLAVSHGQVACEVDIADLSAADVYFDGPLHGSGTGKASVDLALSGGRLVDSQAQLQGAVELVGPSGQTLAATVSTTLRADESGTLDVESSLEGPEAGGVWFLRRARLAGRLQQRSVSQVELEKLELSAEGAGWSDPELPRQLGGDPSLPLGKLAGGRVRLEYTAPGELHLAGAGAVALFPRPGEVLSCAAEFETRCKRSVEATTCSQFEARCAPAAYSPEGAAGKTGRIDVSVRSQDLVLREGVADGVLEIRASDPKDLLLALAAPDLLQRLGVSLLPLGDLRATLRVAQRPQAVAGHVTELSTGSLRSQGKFLWADTLQSHWEVETPVGRFGIEQRPTGATVTPLVGADWLETKGFVVDRQPR